MLLAACGGSSKSSSTDARSDSLTVVVDEDSDSLAQVFYSDTLTAVTLYGPTSYFIYRGEPMGIDYTLAKQFANDHDKALKMFVAPSLPAAIEMLDRGEAEILAWDVPITSYYRNLVLACGPETYTTQVLVQPKVKGTTPVTDVTQLVDRDIYVIADSKYEHRLRNLNDELAAHIHIHTIDPDSATTEDLISMVSNGKIPMTVVDSDIARLNETYFHDLDISVEVSTPQRASWAVKLDNTAMAREIDEWFDAEDHRRANAELLKRYFEQSKGLDFTAFDFSKGYISKYDDLFRKYAPSIDWDWRLLAAQAYAESLFNPRARSWVGARGLMQVMPRTGRGYGASTASLNNPEVSVRVASKLIADLNRYLINLVPNDKERRKFIIAAYNCGIGHVYDAIELAKKYGYDPQVWDDNVERALLMKMNPQYYNDPVVRFGYARGSETSAYVKRIMRFYDTAVKQIPL